MSAICYKCGAVVTQDPQGSWVDNTEGDGCETGVHQGENVTFLREWLGGSEVLSMVGDYDTFALDVIQDYEVADEIIERIKGGDTVIENESEPQYIERYTLITPELAEVLRTERAIARSERTDAMTFPDEPDDSCGESTESVD